MLKERRHPHHDTDLCNDRHRRRGNMYLFHPTLSVPFIRTKRRTFTNDPLSRSGTASGCDRNPCDLLYQGYRFHTGSECDPTGNLHCGGDTATYLEEKQSSEHWTRNGLLYDSGTVYFLISKKVCVSSNMHTFYSPCFHLFTNLRSISQIAHIRLIPAAIPNAYCNVIKP